MKKSLGRSAEQRPIITGVNPRVTTELGGTYVIIDREPAHDGRTTTHVYVPPEMFSGEVLKRIAEGQVEAVSLDKRNDQAPWKIVNLRMR